MALGFGFRCGFLGLLHLEIIQERLTREYDLDLITTAPSVEYHVFTTDGRELLVDNPAALPPPNHLDRVEEPWVSLDIIVPTRYIGAVMEIVQERRGVFKKMDYIDEQRVRIVDEMPLAERSSTSMTSSSRARKATRRSTTASPTTDPPGCKSWTSW